MSDVVASPLSRTMFRKAVCLWNQNWQVELISCGMFSPPVESGWTASRVPVNWHKVDQQRPYGAFVAWLWARQENCTALTPVAHPLSVGPNLPSSWPRSRCMLFFVCYNPGWTYHQTLQRSMLQSSLCLPHSVNLNPTGCETDAQQWAA